MLLAVPNFSEGRDASRVEAVTGQFASGAELLDSHSDPVHNRTVLTLAAPVKRLGEPSEIASIISWLASEEGGYATGADFSVNGGLHMG